MILPLEKTFVANKHMGLGIVKPSIPEAVREIAEQEGVAEKPNVHISVVVTKNAQTLWFTISKFENRSERFNLVESAFNRYAWEYELTDEYFLHERAYSRQDLDENGDTDLPEHTRRTIVQKVVLPDLEPFYNELNEIAGTQLSVPTPHITLFAVNGRGIGINSVEDFERFTKRTINLK